MPTKVSASRLRGVPETLLRPLYNRALESKRTDAIVHDERAVELLGRIDYDFSKFGKLHVGFPVRAKRMDDIVRAFLARYPDGAVVNIGGGLDAQLYRVDNGRVHWFEIDPPESIGVRREFFEETARHRMIACKLHGFHRRISAAVGNHRCYFGSTLCCEQVPRLHCASTLQATRRKRRARGRLP